MGMTMCNGGAYCADLLHDGSNCGTCDHVCPGTPMGDCEGGTCSTGPATLVTGLNAVTQIAIDGTYVYWTESGAGNVTKVPLAGGTPIPVATGQGKPLHLAVDASNVYWTNNLGAAVMSAPVAGGAPTVFAAASSPTHVVIDTDTVYWDDSSYTIWSQKKAGGSPTMITTMGGANLVVSASYVYANTAGGLLLIPKAGGSPVTVLCPPISGSGPFPCAPSVLAVDGTTVYAGGPIDYVDTTGVQDFMFDETDPTHTYLFGAQVGAMAFDGVWRYEVGPFYYNAGFASRSIVQRSPACGSALVLASVPWTTFLVPSNPVVSLATDSGPWVYWSDGASIGRVAK
jgi:hypothetical protein